MSTDSRMLVMSDLLEEDGFPALAAALRDEKRAREVEELLARGEKFYEVITHIPRGCACALGTDYGTHTTTCATGRLEELLGGDAARAQLAENAHFMVLEDLNEGYVFPPVEIRHGGATYKPRPSTRTAPPRRILPPNTPLQSLTSDRAVAAAGTVGALQAEKRVLGPTAGR